MFEVYPVEGSSEKVLVSTDIYTLLNMLGGYGVTGIGARISLLKEYGVDDATIEQLKTDRAARYGDCKEEIMNVYDIYRKEHIDV